MKTISITDWAHEEITKEIDNAKTNEKIPIPTYGSIIDECVNKRYRKRIKEEQSS